MTSKPKTLLDGFGEATEEVVRLRAEVEYWRDACGADHFRRIETLEAENARLRAEIATWGQIWNNAALLIARAEALRDGSADDAVFILRARCGCGACDTDLALE